MADLARLLGPPPSVEPRHRRSYYVMLPGNVVGLVNHAAFLVIFAVFEIWPLAIFNVLSVCVFAFGLYVQRVHGRTLVAMVLGSSEVIVHQLLAVTLMGWDYGFQFYLIVIPALVFLGHFERRSTPVAISAVSVAALAWLWMFGQNLVTPHAQLPDPLRVGLFGLNLLSTATLVAVFSLVYHRTARQNEEALVAAQHAAEAASRAKSEFLANMSHELRTPLNAIIGYSEMLQEDAPDDEASEDLAKIRAAGRHLLGLINDILDLSKIEAGRLETASEVFDPHAVLGAIGEMFAPFVADKPVEFVVDVDPEVPEKVKGDPLRLRQVITNLVGNAIKFTEKGRVSLTARVHGRREGRTFVEFAVQDTGIGIDPDRLRAVFEPFTQANSGVQKRYGGTGLGLSISRRLVELMGGEFDATSELGGGSRFSFRLGFPEA